MTDDVIRIRAVQLTAARRSSDMPASNEVDAAARRYLADQIRLREEQRAAILLWGAEELPPGGPFPSAFKFDPDTPRPPVRPAAGHSPGTGKGSRHLRRKAAAKARH